MSQNPAIRDHLAWLGYLQPDGLVVSPAALVDAQVVLDRAQFQSLQAKFSKFVAEVVPAGARAEAEPIPALKDVPAFLCDFLEWSFDDIYGLDPTRPLPDSLTVPLPEFNETLAPTYALRDPAPKDEAIPWLLLVKVLPTGTNFDARVTHDERGWSASPAQRLERLLRETRVPVGLLINGTHLRLICKPHGENPGSLTFPVGAMTEIAGRPILAALHLLLSRYRLFAAPTEAKLSTLIQKSRDYQSTVSTALAGQVLEALYELLRGFQAANEMSRGALLRDVLAHNPEDIYRGLLNVLLRLVFLLFAEDRGLQPGSDLYVRHYSVHGLFERLRADNECYPDTMEKRFGAWAQLLVLFRAIHGGCNHPLLHIPAREGYLFDSARFPWLEGNQEAPAQLPLVSDLTVFRVLQNLLLLDGERLSYRTLDVEQIGSVYQAMMGFRFEVATGLTVAIKPAKAHGAPPAINLEELLVQKPADRAKWLVQRTDRKYEGKIGDGIKNAATPDDLLATLEKLIARGATPSPVPKCGFLLQPTDERRRSGSHYTPRSFTEPIVRKTLEPILKRLGEKPTPVQILNLKVADIAVGSGAFLVETCRQLADYLVHAWAVHGGHPLVPPDEDEVLLARRIVAQRCLYGVDRNPMAVDIATLSLWLATLAKDHPFTFLDHSIRVGDSLVGLTAKQIAAFTWGETVGVQRVLGQDRLEKCIATATAYRRDILEAGDLMLPTLKAQKLKLADEALDEVRFVGDLAIAALFGAEKNKARQKLRDDLLQRYTDTATDITGRMALKKVVEELRSGRFPVTPFHWEIEFPEVLDRENPGFDAIVGNPPFLGGRQITERLGKPYADLIGTMQEEISGGADLVAHFFRRAFHLARQSGALGLIATNSIAQGDTRYSGLRWICTHGGTIYCARRRYPWPGQATVVVSVVHVTKESAPSHRELDGIEVPIITAYLFHAGGHENPIQLRQNAGKSFQGSIVLGMGFTFDDADSSGTASSIADMEALVAKDVRNRERISPYTGGEEVNDSPTHAVRRYIIDFGELTEQEARAWPDLFLTLERKVKPERITKDAKKYPRMVNEWWKFWNARSELRAAVQDVERVLAVSRVRATGFAFLPANIVYSEQLVVFPLSTFASFAVLQSQVHELWARFFSGTALDLIRYTPTDCFETFPFPVGFKTNAALEATGREYYEFRATLMQDLWLGLTEIYNHFHSPDDEALARLEALYRKRAATSDWRTAEGVPADRSPLQVYATPATALAGVQHLRELHAAMDAAVLTAYGWADLLPRCQCEFLLDYEDEDDGESTGRQRKKPWRYRWPDDVRDEVLARLLKLNAERAEQERLAGQAAAAKPATKRRRKPKVAAAKLSERPLPTEFRLPVEDPMLYSISLVVSLLSEAGGSLPWPRLLDAFVLATEPKLLARLAVSDDIGRAKAWASRWNEAAKAEMIIPALRQLGGNNLAVEHTDDGLEFALQDGPRPHVSDDVAYDAWLALRVAGLLAPQTVPISMRDAWTAQAETVLTA